MVYVKFDAVRCLSRGSADLLGQWFGLHWDCCADNTAKACLVAAGLQICHNDVEYDTTNQTLFSTTSNYVNHCSLCLLLVLLMWPLLQQGWQQCSDPAVRQGRIWWCRSVRASTAAAKQVAAEETQASAAQKGAAEAAVTGVLCWVGALKMGRGHTLCLS
jgi:hypothetical protein